MSDEELLQAYRGTSYRVYSLEDDCVVLEARIGQQQPELDGLVTDAPAPVHADTAPGCWAILTAYNPGQERPSAAENESAQRALKDAIDALGFPVWRACGVEDVPPGKKPFSEPMFCVGHISRSRSEALGRQFRQLAIVFCEPGHGAELVILR